MATIAALKAQLLAKGYAVATSPTLPVSVYTHPLVTAPVVLVGADEATAKPYQEEAVTAAVQRR
jgi:hypothetical protein